MTVRTPVLASIVIMLMVAACGGGDSRVGTVVTRYELQKGDCLNVPEDSTQILPVDCSSATREVLATITLEDSEFEGVDWIKTKGDRVCQAETEGEMDQFYRPSASTWALHDRLVVCLKKIGEDTTTEEASGPPTLVGEFIIKKGVRTGLNLGDFCQGEGGYDDIHSRTQVVVRDGAGVTLATGELSPGLVVESPGGAGFCEFGFEITEIPTADSYSVEVSQRGAVTYTRAVLEGRGWTVSLKLGDGEDDSPRGPTVDAGSSVPLYSSEVRDFSKGFVRASAGQLEAANRELDRVIDSRQQVISCQYGMVLRTPKRRRATRAMGSGMKTFRTTSTNSSS